MTFVPEPIWLVTYEGKDVSDELSPMITSTEFTDQLKGAADELSLTVENRDGRWLEGWFPQKGDVISVKFGYRGEALVDAGRFAIDEPEIAIAADTITLRGQSVPSTSPYRTALFRGWENITLADLGTLLAAELELELVGEIAPVLLARVSQNGETTLAFLKRVAEFYGYVFSIRPPKLIFYPIVTLEAAQSNVTLRKSDLLPGAHFKAQAVNTYVACEVSYDDPSTKTVRRVRVEAKWARTKTIVSGADDLRGVPTIPTRTLRQGVSGEDVRRWQSFLSERGHNPGPVDGIFGPLTRGGTISFQRAASIARDGVAGPETFRVAIEQGFGQVAPAEPGLRVEPAGAVLRKVVRVESVEQAELAARALLDEANRLRSTGSFTTRGNGLIVAGSNITLSDVGRLSGKFSVQSSRHRMSRGGGYTTEAEVSVV